MTGQLQSTEQGRALVPGAPGAELTTTSTGVRVPFPQPLETSTRRRESFFVRNFARIMLLLIVGLPTILAGVYYGFVASDQFVSEMEFGVRSADAQRNDATSIFQGMASASQIGLQSNILVRYIGSREIFDRINRKIDLRDIYSRPSADYFSRLKPGAQIEDQVSFWKGKVEPYFDLTTGVISVHVRAFSPEDALSIGNEILAQSEFLADDLSRRARQDFVGFAQQQVDEASARLHKARQAILDFRDQEKMLDPTKDADVARLAIAKLKDELARVNTELLTARRQLAEGSAMIISYKDRIGALQSQIKEAEGKLTASDQQSEIPLSRSIRGFENLQTERQLAEKFYDTALESLQHAQFEAARRTTYLEVFVRPALAQRALYPRRAVSILIVSLTAFGAWLFLLMVYYSVREHV
jgi:capsular polysaccharide transport system permease protein